jgi:hypothetical protein
MDPAAFATLVERCASPAMAAPLTAIVQQASSFEPFLITLGERKPIRLQATGRNEAIQLATEAAATGKPVRIGLGQLDREEMKLAGLTIANVRGLPTCRGPQPVVPSPISNSVCGRRRFSQSGTQHCQELCGERQAHNARAGVT